MSIELPVKVGDVYWLPEHNATRATRKCSVCAGHGAVWVRNIEGDEFEVRCEACGTGYENCLGTETYYSYEPRVTRFEVQAINGVTFGGHSHPDGGCAVEIDLTSTTGRRTWYEYLYATEAEALEKSKESMERIVRENMGRSLSRKKSCLPEHAWSARYHNNEIKEAELKIAWHKTRLLSKKLRSKEHVVEHSSPAS